MKVYELAEQVGKPSAEVKKDLGVSSHLSVITQEVADAYKASCFNAPASATEEPIIDAVENKEVITPKPKQADKNIPPLEEIELSCRCLGNKSKLWKYKHLLGE